jgi:catechol 2,3-dioxygenase-like lactoylglutathione lyase family enzyme
MQALGFRKGTTPIAGERHLHYFNPVTQYTIRPAKDRAAHDPYRPGLHHVCFRVARRDDVDTAAAALRALGIDVSEPRLYPEYAPDYYAAFFADPDGIRLELVAHRHMRSLIRDNWDRLTEFEDPLTKAGLL